MIIMKTPQFWYENNIFFVDFVGRGRSMARWKALEKTNLYNAHLGSRTWLLWAGKAISLLRRKGGSVHF